MATNMVDKVIAKYPCPACGYLVFGEPPGSYALCPVCDWEDDALQLEYATTLSGGANPLTLLEWQRHAGAKLRIGSHVRDLEWRPIDLERDEFEAFHAPSRRPISDDPIILYYWRETFWRRNPAT